ncbi:hypothetical protein F4694_005678 [Bacillus niacini]|uniref:HNH nuclease domain-containing protein n=1 Tax=Neobacillus niacini TaxID=86668 RepID=A0A852TJ84_9BACI|nr:HNH endonuclease [Neobacillus niacini]NYE08822.1 hypothetical protein [Neobacillus niacini]
MSKRNKDSKELGVFLSGNMCVICGWNKKNRHGKLKVIGAHVLKFESAPEYDKYSNIIGLCPSHHAEFDDGNFTIDYLHKKAVFYYEDDEYHNKTLKGSINHVNPRFFIAHQRDVFKKLINEEID